MWYIRSSDEGSEGTVFRRRRSAGIEAYVEICVSSFPVDRGGLVMMGNDDHERAITHQERGVQWCG